MTLLQHFAQLSIDDKARLLRLTPRDVSLTDASKRVAATALGAALYTPGTHLNLPRRLEQLAAAGVTTSVLDLEDAVPDAMTEQAAANIAGTLDQIGSDGTLAPALFVRPRTPDHLTQFAQSLTVPARRALAGFMLPKFSPISADAWLTAVARTADEFGQRVWACPILESADLVHRRTQNQTLDLLQDTLSQRADQVLGVRVGATDMMSTFGLRRSPDMTIWDVQVIAQVLGAIASTFTVCDGDSFVVSGPVWEHFGHTERLVKPALRQSPFDRTDSQWVRSHMLANHIDNLLLEVERDLANGLVGKTVIHPTHAGIVNAMCVPTSVEYDDAQAILAAGSGVTRSQDGRMNEARPHTGWANNILERATAFGVLAPHASKVDLMRAVVTAAEEAPTTSELAGAGR